MKITDLQPRPVWEIFEMIASIPHGSGNEAALAQRLMAEAQSRGLHAELDSVNNLLVKRPASPGMEKCPKIIMQGHLDMVTIADKEFDFVNTPITLKIDGDRLTADGTTLGADDGIGVALALALLFDKDLQAGELTGIFTVAEETGLTGAAAVSPQWLDGDMLFNLDGGSETGFCIGCAGGARQEFQFDHTLQAAPAGIPVKLTLGGLEGGHSGCCIHMERGNALKLLAGFIDQFPALRLADFAGGSADNAIPAEAVASAVLTCGSIAELQAGADFYISTVRSEFNAPESFFLKIEDASAISQVWSDSLQHNFVSALTLVPDAVIEYDEELAIVKTSSNCAAVMLRDDKIIVRTSQRSLDDECRELISNTLKIHFANFGATSTLGNAYPGWKPNPSSTLTRIAPAVWEKMYGNPIKVSAIHAGLECGWFFKKNPALQLLTLGPIMDDIHTPQEWLSIPSVAKYYKYFKELFKALYAQQ